jgi:hypothetical protein
MFVCIYTIYVLKVNVRGCVFAIEIQTIGPISMKFGTIEYHDPGMVFVYVRIKYGLMLAS